MAVTTLNFAEAVRAWTNQTEDKLESVFKKSFEMTCEAIRANTPIDTGNLVASFVETIGDPVSIDPMLDGKKKKAVVRPSAIPSAKLGDTLSGAFSAAYARRIEYGFVGQDSLGRNYNQTGRAMVRLAVDRFPEFVAAAIKMADTADGSSA